MTASFIRHVTTGTEHPIYMVSGCDYTGRDAWYFLRVQKRDLHRFETMLAKKQLMELDRFGTILLKGYGVLSPGEIRQKLAECERVPA